MKESSGHSLRYRLLVLAGGLPMLAAVAVEVLAVLGRAGPWPLPGSIEVVQVLILLSGMTAMVVATLNGSHARVRLLLDRLTDLRAGALTRLNYGLAALFFLLLFLGSAWLLFDLWGSQEESEIWRLPYRPLRILVASGCLLVALLFLWRCLRGRA